MGGPSRALAPVWKHLPSRSGEHGRLEASYDPIFLLPADRRTYRYMGSLTTPTCSEGVRWMVMERPIRVSRGQVEAFRRLFPFNSRPVQPLNGRQPVADSSP
jgi:carbonic anhydrase